MARISKDPAVRKKEIVMAACELFKEKGFEQVTVSDIVKNVGVAQGTFYYYFATKYDILDAVIDHYMEDAIGHIQLISADNSLNALEKLRIIINYSLKIGVYEKNFIEFLHSDENLVTHQKYMIKSFEATIPFITRVVDEGIREGLFSVQYPRETVELMVYMHGYLHDSLMLSRDREEFIRKLGAAQEIFEKVLGVKKGALELLVKK